MRNATKKRTPLKIEDNCGFNFALLASTLHRYSALKQVSKLLPDA